ncbi:hypothetical protein [Citrobacter amalonaticus]|nr:hypothetical protein [Citrobacter amalonaticus]
MDGLKWRFPNHFWGMDFVSDALFDGSRLHLQRFIDLFTSECRESVVTEPALNGGSRDSEQYYVTQAIAARLTMNTEHNATLLWPLELQGFVTPSADTWQVVC